VNPLNDRQEPAGSPRPEPGRRAGLYLTGFAALTVLLLAVGALLFPAGRGVPQQGTLLVFDPTGDLGRSENMYRPLAGYLEQASGRGVTLQVARTREEFLAASRQGAGYLLCPDGLALQVDPALFEPLAVGRRAAPRNLRPRGVLVYRKAAGLVTDPWASRPSRTVVGDSLSLCSSGPVLAGAQPGDLECSWGPDPYDHAPVLHAARLGAFDYAVVRQWDADRFLADGLLSGAEWGLEVLCDPVPDLVVMASRSAPRARRMEVGESLSGFARNAELTSPAEQALTRGLPLLRLVGFNLLLEPDFERVRGNFKGHWQAVAD
jgi:hypothetical protein